MPWTIRVLLGLGAAAVLLLTAVAVTAPRVFRLGPSAESRAQVGMRIVADVVDEYRTLLGRLPPDLAVLTEASPATGQPWFDSVPVDPWGAPFVYRVVGEEGFALHSTGPDGQDGTDDDVRYVP